MVDFTIDGSTFMSVMTLNAMDTFENGLIARNEQAESIASIFVAVTNTVQQLALCSDCCSSNGNSCDPNETYPQ